MYVAKPITPHISDVLAAVPAWVTVGLGWWALVGVASSLGLFVFWHNLRHKLNVLGVWHDEHPMYKRANAPARAYIVLGLTELVVIMVGSWVADTYHIGLDTAVGAGLVVAVAIAVLAIAYKLGGYGHPDR